ncbi:MAG: TetR/AcrR family transcriptional regulator [Gemmatimonadetes bacterium]|nr:TetR/AcrR family transcriptional regulator [Gemmatimonadota bacterium]
MLDKDQNSPSRARRDREKADTRRRILEAARELFTKQGYAQSSMRRIADQIGYTATAIYHHFRDKDALLNELCLNDFRALNDALRHMDQIDDPITKLRLMGQNYVKFALAHPQQFRFMFLVERPMPGPDCITIDPTEDGYGFLLANIREAIDRGLLRPEYTDAEMVAQVVWAGVHGLSAIHLHSPERHHPWLDLRDPDETANVLTEVLLRGLLREQQD